MSSFVVLGAEGMLGSDVVAAVRRLGEKVIPFSRQELDVRDRAALEDRLPAAYCVINCAAFSSIPEAQTAREEAFAVNNTGAGYVAQWCARRRVRLVHISCSEVFDGRKNAPYTERDLPAPLNIFAASLAMGERTVRAEGGLITLVRLPMLLGVRGDNFAKTLIRRIWEQSGGFYAAQDNSCTPTCTHHAAEVIVKLALLNRNGVVHVGAEGVCSHMELAQHIVHRMGARIELLPCGWGDLQKAVPRPRYSVLATERLALWLNHKLPAWRDEVDDYLRDEGLLK